MIKAALERVGKMAFVGTNGHHGHGVGVRDQTAQAASPLRCVSVEPLLIKQPDRYPEAHRTAEVIQHGRHRGGEFRVALIHEVEVALMPRLPQRMVGVLEASVADAA